jgi:hypothetical protein
VFILVKSVGGEELDNFVLTFNVLDVGNSEVG